MRALGLTSVENRFDPIPGRPLVVVATDGRTELELCVADRSDNGAYFDLPGADGLDRVWMPPDLVSHPPQHLDENVVRTISPLALVHVRIASAIAFGGQRPKDVAAQAALRERFFAGMSDAELAPTITRA